VRRKPSVKFWLLTLPWNRVPRLAMLKTSLRKKKKKKKKEKKKKKKKKKE
jgi:hypothetical protein